MNEISIQSTIQCANGNYSLPATGGGRMSIDQVTAGGTSPQIEALIIGVDVDLSGLVSEGMIRILNQDEVNYVTWGPKSGGNFYPIGKLKPGEAALFRLDPGMILHIKGDTDTCKVQVIALED